MLQKDLTAILYDRIRFLTDAGQKDNKRLHAAKCLPVFQIVVRSYIHHQIPRERCLRKTKPHSLSFEAVRHVRPQFIHAFLFHEYALTFCLIGISIIDDFQSKGHEAHLIIALSGAADVLRPR